MMKIAFVAHEQPQTHSRPMHPQTQSALMSLPNELIFDILRRVSTTDLARVEQASRLCAQLAQPSYKHVYGPGPQHRALPPAENYKTLAIEQATHARRASAVHDPVILIERTQASYLYQPQAKALRFAAEGLLGLQNSSLRSTLVWHEACASLLMLQQRLDEALSHYQHIFDVQGYLPPSTGLIAARYGWSFVLPPHSLNALDDRTQQLALFAAIAGHNQHAILALGAQDPNDPVVRLQAGQAATVAARHGNVAALRACLAAGAEVQTLPSRWWGLHTFVSCNAAIWEASHQGHLETVRLLLEHGALADRRSDGRGLSSALDVAISENHIDVTNLLMASLSHHQRTTTDGLRLKQLFGPGRASAAQRCALLQDLVVKWGVNINGVGRDGKTFLHLAADAKDTNLVAAAVALGADCDRKDASGQTPLELALNHDANTIAAMLRVHTRDTAARTLSFEAKSGLAFNVLTQISKLPSPHLKRSPQRLCSQLAPFVYAPPGASVPQAIQFAEQRHALYIRAFSAETLWAWQTHFAGCTTTAWASHLSDIMRVIDIEGSGRMPSVLTRVEEREQIFSLCNTWVLPRQETRLSAKNAFVHAVSQHVAPEQRRALLLLPHTPFGRRLAAGMRNKYEYEVQLWRAFGERVASSPTNITEY